MSKFIAVSLVGAIGGAIVGVAVIDSGFIVDGYFNKEPFNELCHKEKIADYDLAWNRIYDAQISLEICREPDADTSDPTNYCALHADMEAKILEAVPCMRTAIETDKRLGIVDELQVRVTERQLDEYLAMRNNPDIKAFDQYTQDAEVTPIP